MLPWIEYFRHAELVSASLKPWVSISVRRMWVYTATKQNQTFDVWLNSRSSVIGVEKPVLVYKSRIPIPYFQILFHNIFRGSCSSIAYITKHTIQVKYPFLCCSVVLHWTRKPMWHCPLTNLNFVLMTGTH